MHFQHASIVEVLDSTTVMTSSTDSFTINLLLPRLLVVAQYSEVKRCSEDFTFLWKNAMEHHPLDKKTSSREKGCQENVPGVMPHLPR